MQAVTERVILINQQLIFFELELIQTAADKGAEVIADPALAHFRHYLEMLGLRRDHVLSEPEERIVNPKTFAIVEIIQGISLRENRFGIEPEVTIKLARIPRIRVYEVGISYSGRTYDEGKKIGWKDGLKALYCIAKYGLLRVN